MKRSEHTCAASGCDKPCPREHPFCTSCWRMVPKELRKAVREELAKRGTEELDRSGIYHAVHAAAASVAKVAMTDGARSWELLYMQAGQPGLEEKRR